MRFTAAAFPCQRAVGDIMFRIGIVFGLWLLGGSERATAQALAERGAYLVNTIMACGNCHSPRDADGKLIKEKAFFGGPAFTTPAFIATAPNITPDGETGIGSWSDAEIKHAPGRGNAPEPWPPRRRTAGRDHAGQFLQSVAAQRSQRRRRLSAHHQAGPQRSRSPRLQSPGAPRSLPRCRGRIQQSHVGRSGQARRLSRHHRPLHGMPFRMVARRFGFQRPDWASGRQGVSRRARDHRRERHSTATNITSDPAAGIGAWTDQKSSAPSPMALAAMDGRSSRRWPTALLCRTESRPIWLISSPICAPFRLQY